MKASHHNGMDQMLAFEFAIKMIFDSIEDVADTAVAFHISSLTLKNYLQVVIANGITPIS